MKISPVDVEAYCFHCKKKTKSTVSELIDDGKHARLAGICKVCNGKTSLVIGRDKVAKYKGGKSGGCDCPYAGADAGKTATASEKADMTDFGIEGGARRRKSRKSGSRKSRKSRKSGSRKSRGSRKTGSRKSRKSRGSRKTGSRKSRKSRGSRKGK